MNVRLWLQCHNPPARASVSCDIDAPFPMRHTQSKSTNAVHQVSNEQECEYASLLCRNVKPDTLLVLSALLWREIAVEFGGLWAGCTRLHLDAPLRSTCTSFRFSICADAFLAERTMGRVIRAQRRSHAIVRCRYYICTTDN